MTNVITVTRQFGSLGRKIARQVAEDLGYEYYDRDIIELAVSELRGDINRLEAFDGQKITPFEKMMYPLGMGNASMKRSLFEMEQSIMVDLASKKNCVIVGRCADYVLHKYGINSDRRLSVYIYAPIEKRLSRCKADLGIDDPGEAFKYLTKVDKARESFYKEYTKMKFNSNKYRHLMIDSSMADVESVAKIITTAAKAKFGI